METLITMSKKELTRLERIIMAEAGEITQVECARQLDISDRQLRRLVRGFRQEGESFLISKRRGRPSNNRLDTAILEKAASTIKKEYPTFGPTLANQKLREKHRIILSIESTRKLMIKEGIWKFKRKRKPHIHQSRDRRDCFGELIQIDGSPHAWFDDRAPKCCLIAFIDDATSIVTGLKFVEAETTNAYFEVLKDHLVKYGRPVCLYSDRHSIFRVNTVGAIDKGNGLTQFGRALTELGIKLVCANSPQAKGRVERLFKTLQDRLVKEMRLEGISSMGEGNTFLSWYLKDHNERFSVQPEMKSDSHRSLFGEHDLDKILCRREYRTLSKNLELSVKGRLLQIKTDRPTYAMRGASVEIVMPPGKEIELYYKNNRLEFKELLVKSSMGKIVDSKNLNNEIHKRKAVV